MFTGTRGGAGSFLRQSIVVKEESLVIHVCWILLWDRGDRQLSPKGEHQDGAEVPGPSDLWLRSCCTHKPCGEACPFHSSLRA